MHGYLETLAHNERDLSDVSYHERIQDLLQRNGYPAGFIKKHPLPQQDQLSEE